MGLLKQHGGALSRAAIAEAGVWVVAHSTVEWIIKKFSGRSVKIIYNKKEFPFDRGELTKIVEETITYKRK